MNKHIFAFIAGICLTTSMLASNENAQQQVTTNKKISPLTALIRTIHDHAYLIAGINTTLHIASETSEAIYLIQLKLGYNPSHSIWHTEKAYVVPFAFILLAKTLLTGVALKFFSGKILTYLEQSENN